MNYADFYTSAKRMLIDSIVSIWFRGSAKEQEYMRHILTEEEPLLSEPVFQSIFPWEDSKETFGEHASKLGILSPSFVESLSSEHIEKDLRFPLDRHPYKHQTKSWKTMLSDKDKTIVVTSGTGSGKTECFMIPVLQDIANRNEKNCVQAIFLYPLNALMKSQQKRIHAWCSAMSEKITYAIYNGDTEKASRSTNYTDSYLPQLITRPQIRQTPPQVLFTNPTMLNYMLVRSEDKEILEKSKGKLKWILLDEAHTYTGSSAAELSLQLRRVLDAFGVTIEQVNFAVTSATIGDEKDPNTEIKLKTFVSQLTGKPVDSIVVIGGKRIIPEMNCEIANTAIEAINKKYGINITINDIEKLRKKLNTNPVITTTEIAKQIDKSICKDTVKSLEVIDSLANKVKGLNNIDGTAAALLPSRIHYFIRSISGVYVCTNPKCSHHKKIRVGLGSLTTYQNTNCPVCKSKMLEVATCPSCGGSIIVGETSTSKGYRMHTNSVDLDSNFFYDTNEDLIQAEEQELENKISKQEVDGFTPFYFAKPIYRCLRHHTTEDVHVFNHEKNKIELADENEKEVYVYKSLRHSDKNQDLCPHCGNSIGRLNYLRASATQMGRVLSTLILDNAEGSDKKDAEILYEGKKYITFTDNRQGSARSAMGLNQDVERAWVRSSIFHKLADMRIDKFEPCEMTEVEEQTYTSLKGMEESSLLPFMKKELSRLEAKKSGNTSIPEAQEVAWNEISQTLENNSDLRKLFKHLSDARNDYNFRNANMYLKALLIDQFGWIPKRANSLENMGIIRLVYPELKKAKCPALLLSKGCKDEDWQDFLKIGLDYIIRGGRHYMISGEYSDYLTQNRFTSAIYPKDSDLRKNKNPVAKWPVVRQKIAGVQEEQSRLVLLLCAVLGYNDIENFNDEKIADLNNLLTTAWNFITSNILEVVDIENRGYMLDLLGSKVKMQLLDKGYLCPVDNIIVDVCFYGYSPRMNGYIGKNNSDRFKVTKEFKYSYFPFKSTEPSQEDIISWITTNFEEQRKSGVFSNIHERVYVQKPIFIAAEHSAQQSREDLDKYEQEFNEGHINILSCSTTMEMGVDIGGISEVVMNNVPPKSANYLQRAGRAGRRNESKALALTFCAPNPIGTYTWEHPNYPITHITETPLLKLESRQLIQRHVNALVFASFVADYNGIRITSNVEDFFEASDDISYYDRFLTYIDKIIGGQIVSIEKSYSHLIKGTALDNISLNDAVYSTKKDISVVSEKYKTHIESLVKSIESIKEQDGTGAASIAIEYQKNNFLKTSLLTYLAEGSFLPSAGIPTGLVECMLGLNNNSNNPTMHLSQAISSYAPGSQVVKNEWIYEPSGIRLKTKYDDNTSRYILQNCTNCGYTTINYGSAMNHCPKCGKQDSMHGIKDMSIVSEQRFTEVVEPAAFSVAWGTKPTRKMNGQGSMNFIQPILLEMEPWQEKTSSAKMTVRCSSLNSEILFYNRAHSGYGFAFCTYCGKMEAEKSIDVSDSVMRGHKHLSTGTPCPGGDAGGRNLRRHVLLVGRYQTDFVEIKFYNGDNSLETDPETLYSLGVILSRKLTELLGVNDGEIDFGYNNASHSIFIYDTALGGAGYSPLFREYKDKVLEMAYNTLSGCNCERSCTKCLIDRRSQWYLNYLNRQKALDWLETERKSRIAPERIALLIPDAASITTDFTAEFYQLSRNKNINSIMFFIDDNYSMWQPNDFPYIKHVNELSIAGVDVSFVLEKDIDITNCSSSIRTIIMSALFQYRFKFYKNSLAGDLKPLLYVSFNDGTKKLYFGDDIDTSFTPTWGNGDIFATINTHQFNCETINGIQIFNSISDGEGTIMFDTRIKEDSCLNSLYHSLTKDKTNYWNRIIGGLNGKNVAIQYSDRYLVTPLGCIILAHLLEEIKQEFNIIITSLSISTAKPNSYNDIIDNTINICSNYKNCENRNRFLSDAISNIVGIQPTINNDGYIEHERCLTILSETSELCIRPDAGVANGWKPFGQENAACSDEDFRYNWTMDMKLYNQKKNIGILYTISYIQNT